jgi:hypothetical protein
MNSFTVDGFVNCSFPCALHVNWAACLVLDSHQWGKAKIAYGSSITLIQVAGACFDL